MTDNIQGNLGVPLTRLVQTVTSLVLVNNTAKTIDFTVPSNKRWRILWARMGNGDDVARDVTVRIYLEAAKTNLLGHIINAEGINAGATLVFPSKAIAAETELEFLVPIILDPGNTIEFLWAAGGASTGGTDTDGCVLCYLEVKT